jgi:large subunit ribosomal protein L2
MSLVFLKPITPSQRRLVKLNREKLTKNPTIKKNITGHKASSGRNHSGRITVRRKGGGHKKKFRTIDFLRNYKSIGIVISIEYDPYRTANIAAIFDFTKRSFFYTLAPKKLSPGNIVESGFEADLHTGNSLPLFKIPEGSFIHNVTLNPGKAAQITRAAGSFSILKEKTRKYAKIKISSKEDKVVPIECYASLGVVSNEEYFLTQLGKAGQSRWLNKRPKVRGVAMNPVDHPHGGGEGKKSGKNFTPWGKPNTKKTSSKKK